MNRVHGQIVRMNKGVKTTHVVVVTDAAPSNVFEAVTLGGQPHTGGPSVVRRKMFRYLNAQAAGTHARHEEMSVSRSLVEASGSLFEGLSVMRQELSVFMARLAAT